MTTTTLSNRELWQNALVQIELSTSETSFRTWFRNTDIASRNGGTVQVAVPSKIVKEGLIEKPKKLFLRSPRGPDASVRGVAYGVLIMDDVQFVANTEKTQEELFHLFNTLYDNNKQIVFSSDKHPAMLAGLEERLRGRSSAGMIAEIPEPDMESRVAIIGAKLESHGFSIPEDIILLIAENVRGNIRELEGILNMIVCRSQLKGKGITQADVRTL